MYSRIHLSLSNVPASGHEVICIVIIICIIVIIILVIINCSITVGSSGEQCTVEGTLVYRMSLRVGMKCTLIVISNFYDFFFSTFFPIFYYNFHYYFFRQENNVRWRASWCIFFCQGKNIFVKNLENIPI